MCTITPHIKQMLLHKNYLVRSRRIACRGRSQMTSQDAETDFKLIIIIIISIIAEEDTIASSIVKAIMKQKMETFIGDRGIINSADLWDKVRSAAYGKNRQNTL